MNDTALPAIMMFHIDSGINILTVLLENELVDTAMLGDLISERAQESESIQEERVWSALRAFLFQEGRILNFPKDLQGPDREPTAI